MNIAKKTRALLTALMFLFCAGAAFAHGVQVRWNVTPEGNIRVWIEHWHSATESVSGFPLEVYTVVDGDTTYATYQGTGAVNYTAIAGLPDGGSSSIHLSSCTDANNYNNWVYWDFAPPACNIPINVTVISGPSSTTMEGCGTLYPQTIITTLNDVSGPVITANDLNIAPTMNCDSVLVTSYGATVTVADVCGYVGGDTVSYSIPEGSVFSLGSTPVVITATDSLGNTSVDTFNVVVSPDDWTQTNNVNVCYGNDYTFPDGTMISNMTSDSSRTQYFTRANGCDSTYTTSVTVIHPVYGTSNIDLCYGASYSIGSSTYTTSGTYIDTISAASGCDSIVTSYVSIAEDLGQALTINLDTLVGAEISGASYRWLRCDSSYAVVSGAMNSWLHIAESGNYALETTKGGCVDTSGCTTVTIIENLPEIIATGKDYAGIVPNTYASKEYTVIFSEVQTTIQYILVNEAGIVVLDNTVTNASGFTINLGTVPSGTVYLSVNSPGGNIHNVKILNQ